MTEPKGMAGGLLHQLERASRTEDWWTSDMASLLIDPAQIRDFVAALAGITTVLREGEDPMWIVGGTTPAAAFALVHEWLDAGINAGEVSDWVRAGCRDPKAGLRPGRLLDGERRPASLDRGRRWRPDAGGAGRGRQISHAVGGGAGGGPAVTRCTWTVASGEPAGHQVDCQTRPGLILDDEVCDGHLEEPQRPGYLLPGSVEPHDVHEGTS